LYFCASEASKLSPSCAGKQRWDIPAVAGEERERESENRRGERESEREQRTH
jgi:hypothetical protein